MSTDERNDQRGADQRGADERVSDRWPVLLERPLLRAESRWWRRYRNPDILPLLQPGCIYVFAVGGRHEVCTDAATLCGDEPMLVSASWLSVVSMRFRRFTVWTRVPTSEPMADFAVGVTFGCTVTDACAVARDGLLDLRGELENYVRHHPDLHQYWHRFAPDAVANARAAIVDSLNDYYPPNPPEVAGVRLSYEGVVVSPSRALLRHQTQLRDIKWSHIEEMERVKKVHDDLLNSPERAEATAVARQERTADQVAARQFADRDTQTERLMAQVKEWLGSDAAKRAPVDRRRLAEALFTRLIDKPSPEPQWPSGLVELPETDNGKADSDVLMHITPDDLDET
jgi:hypothetical protein